jgi:two-component system OmpR family sensor kinase
VLARLPIRVRLTAAFALVMAIVLAVTGLFLYVRLESALDGTLEDGLRSRAQDVASLVRQSGSGLSEGVSTGLLERGESYAQVLTLGGRVLDTTPQLGTEPLLEPGQLARARRGPIMVDRGPIGASDDRSRVLALPISAQGRRLIVAVGTTLDTRDEALAGLRTQLFIGGPLALLVASVAGYGLAAFALRPVESMRVRAARIRGVPDQRLPVPPADDEIRRLGDTLNEMLDRIASTMRRERRFVADASHELRTPLAMLRAELELAGRRERTYEELAEAVHSATEETERLSQLAEDLLVLAHADEGRLPVQREPLSVADLLEHTVRRFRSRADSLGRAIVVEPSGETIEGDRLRLEQALGNLVDNALRHGAGTVWLRASTAPGQIRLHITDHGPGFPAEFLPHAFERFARADEARTRGGSGLGLSIVAVIAEAHGGAADAANRDEGGAEVWILLPHERPSADAH